MESDMAMTKGERDQLLQLVKKRERVMKVKAQERSAALLAEFDIQSAKIHHWDDDAICARAIEEAGKAIEAARLAIAARCSEMGIPAEFAPDLYMAWQGRGHNAVQSRRVELRRAARSKIEAIERAALSTIEQLSLGAQTEIIAHGLESDAARAFLETMPPIEQLMPPLTVEAIHELIEAKRVERKQIGYLN